MVDLSVCLGTANRCDSLARCIESGRKAIDGLSYEFIVVDGGSTDNTLPYLRAQADVRLIEHGAMLGCVKAYNDAFAKATGKYAAHITDDNLFVGLPLQEAVEALERDTDIGQVAIPYGQPGSPRMVKTAKVMDKSYLFASFGVTRRELGEQVSWFDGFNHFCGDCYLSVSIQRLGFSVIALPVELGSIELHQQTNPHSPGVKDDWRRWGRMCQEWSS